MFVCWQNQSAFEARLRLKSISEADALSVYRLLVESNMNGEPMTEEYLVRISMNAAPLQCKSNNDCSSQQVSTFDSDSLATGVSGAGIAAIIITMIAILVIVAVVLYARNTGRWCFAG